MRSLITTLLLALFAGPLMAGGPHVIPAEKAKAMVEAYAAKAKTAGPAATTAATADAAATALLFVEFPKEAIQQFLKQKGLARIRVYNALNDDGKETIVFLGVDAAGNLQDGPGQSGVDNGEPCPPRCPPGPGTGGGGDD